MAAAANVPYFTLNNSFKMPSIGMGCWLGPDGGLDVVEDMCKNALKCGYRHIDTAAGYANEALVGKAIRESGIPRSEIFLTSKLPNEEHHRVRESFEETFKKLNCEYIDLYLMHWPQASVDGKVLQPEEHPTIVDTWKEMEKLLETGKVRSIGVSNFSVKTIQTILAHCKVVPAVNQVEMHPCLPHMEMKGFCDAKGILLTAYSPFGQGNHLFFSDTDFVNVAKAHNASVAQVAVAWAVQRGTVAIPKSVHVERIKSNIALIQLTPEEMKLIDGIHKKPGMHRSLLGYHAPNAMVFGWTYEQLGWPMTTGGIVP
ncbi:hypothetical protein NM688_g859 [Phlebia brevispora]|uniref:Uncharacterized protein n=1 Tax=Phlebia brevispora TaxID=194682 RepID=A0ACC1TD97_9APHY|nr:hypothetical protein NM688_g859 [Phlebia brevispora]